jgi:hypothetical protein
MELVTSMDWLTEGKVFGEASMRLMLLDQDVASVQIAYVDYCESKERLFGPKNTEIDKLAQARVFHNAKVFVSSVRRVGRLAESMSANRAIFGSAAKEMQLAWRKKKASFDAYIEPRNAIEHIDGEINGKESWYMMNLENDSLKVTDEAEHSADISAATVEMVVAIRNEIVEAVKSSNA